MFLELLLSLLALLLSRTLWRRWKYDLHKIPSPPGLPLVGHTLMLSGNRGESEFLRFIAASWKRLGEPRIFKVNFTGRELLFLHDIDEAKKLLTQREIPVKRGRSATLVLTPLTTNKPTVTKLINSPEGTPYVKAVRRVYANGLQSHCLKAGLPKLHGVLDKMIEVIEAQRQKGPIDFQELCSRMSLDAIGAFALGTTLGGLDNSRLLYKLIMEVGHIRRSSSNVLQALLYKAFPFLEDNRTKNATINALTAEWETLADEILARDNPPDNEEPFWHSFKTLTDPATGKTIEYDRFVGEIAGLTIGGTDTTGHQLAFIVALLACSPVVVDKITAELKEHDLDGPQCREMTLEDLGKLVYLSAVVKEGMRVTHVSTSAFERELKEDATILGYRLPKGTGIIVAGLRGTNSESDWDHPDEFRPERWLRGDDISKKFYIPFGYGPRDCAGQKLAILEMRVAIARLFQRYCMTSSHTVKEIFADCRTGLITEAAEGIWLHVEPRS